MGARTHPYSGEPGNPLAGRWPAAQRIHPYVRSVLKSGRSRGRDRENPVGYRRLADHRARALISSQAGGDPGPYFQRPFPVRRGRRLDSGRNAEPRHPAQPALAGLQGAHRGHESPVDAGRSLLPRRVRELRPGLVLPQAADRAAPAHHSGQHELQTGPAARSRSLRRLAAHRDPD